MKAVGSVERKMLARKNGYLKYWNNNWKGKRAGRHMERRNVDILCLRETKWKGSKARNIADG